MRYYLCIRYEERTVGVERHSRIDAGPHDWCEAHRKANGTNAVVNITVGRTPVQGSDTKDVLDDLLRPAKFSDEHIGFDSRRGRMTPSVYSNLVLSEVFLLQDAGVGDGSRTDTEDGSRQVLLIEVLKQIRSVRCGTIVVRKTPGKLCGAVGDISVPGASTACPPASSRVCSSLGVCRTSAWLGDWDVWNRDARILDILDPLLDLG